MNKFPPTICGPFCLFFLSHLYNPHPNLNVQDEEKSIALISKVLDSIFSHDEDPETRYDENTKLLMRFVRQYNIKGNFL